MYYDADVMILDDPLSAGKILTLIARPVLISLVSSVDAHVGKALFHGAIVNSRNQGKSVILVTHALHFLSSCDYIYALDDGRIAEHGTYDHLLAMKGKFARLDKEFGGNDPQDSPGEVAQASAMDIAEQVRIKSAKASQGLGGGNKLAGKLMVKERRTTGSISWKGASTVLLTNAALICKTVYWTYLIAGRGSITGPLLLLAIVMMQGSQLMNSYTLVWWQAKSVLT